MFNFNNGKPLFVHFIFGQPVEYSLPSIYLPPTNGIITTYPVPTFYPNMIKPTISYVSPIRLNPFIQQYGVS